MIPHWPEHWAKLAFRKRTSGVLCNYCKKAAARIRWTRRASITWGCLTCSLSKSPKPRRPWNVHWQLGFRSRLFQKLSAGWLSPRQSNGFVGTTDNRRIFLRFFQPRERDHETHNEKHYAYNQSLVAFYGCVDLALARNQLTNRF